MEAALKQARNVSPRDSIRVKKFRADKKSQKRLSEYLFDMNDLFWDVGDIVGRVYEIVKKFDRSVISKKKIQINSVYRHQEEDKTHVGVLFLINEIQYGTLAINKTHSVDECDIVNALITDMCEIIIETHEQ